MRRVVVFAAIAAALAALAEAAGARLDPGALRAAAPMSLWLLALICFTAPHRVPAADGPPEQDPVDALAEGIAAASSPRDPGAFVGAIRPLVVLLPAWCAAGRWFGAPGDAWPLAAIGLAACAAGGLSTSGRAVGAFGALVAAAVALGVGPDGWMRSLKTAPDAAAIERPAALLAATLDLEGPLGGAEVGYAGFARLEVDVHLAAGESAVVRAPVPGPSPTDAGDLDPLAGEPRVVAHGPGAVRLRALAPPAPLDGAGEAALARARPSASAIASRSGSGAGRRLAGWALLLAAATAAIGAAAVAIHVGPLRGVAAALLLTAGVGVLPLGAEAVGPAESEAPAHVVHEGQRLADGGLAWWTVRRVALPARVRSDDLVRLRMLPGARAPRCRAVVRGGEGAIWLLPPAGRPAAVDVVRPAEDLRFAVVTPEVNTLGDLEAAWWRGADGEAVALGRWARGAGRPAPAPGGEPPPAWGFAAAPLGREVLLGRLTDGAWVRVVL